MDNTKVPLTDKTVLGSDPLTALMQDVYRHALVYNSDYLYLGHLSIST